MTIMQDGGSPQSHEEHLPFSLQARDESLDNSNVNHTNQNLVQMPAPVLPNLHHIGEEEQEVSHTLNQNSFGAPAPDSGTGTTPQANNRNTVFLNDIESSQRNTIRANPQNSFIQEAQRVHVNIDAQSS